MALTASSSSRGGGGRVGGAGERITEPLQLPYWKKKWKDRDTSPERTPVWTEPSNTKLKSYTNSNNVVARRSALSVAVIYYLCRNGQLEHPHFLEVPLHSSQGLYLIDFTNRLNLLRGKGMANLYSWSAKRSYKNGYVWHDLEENDLIHPVNCKEYVLMGSEILLRPSSSASVSTSCSISKSSAPASSSTSGSVPQQDSAKSGELVPDLPSTRIRRRRNQSWSSVDLHEYKVYKAEPNGDHFTGKEAAADASTQTDEKRRRMKLVRKKEEDEEASPSSSKVREQQSTELSGEEVSPPPPSESSPETLESLMKADSRSAPSVESDDRSGRDSDRTPGGGDPAQPAGTKVKASSVLMSLITCGSVSFKDCGATKDRGGFSLLSHYKSRLPRSANQEAVTANEEDEVAAGDRSCSGSFAKVALEDKEYFSGSLIETRRSDFSALKRSSSYNADR